MDEGTGQDRESVEWRVLEEVKRVGGPRGTVGGGGVGGQQVWRFEGTRVLGGQGCVVGWPCQGGARNVGAVRCRTGGLTWVMDGGRLVR